MWLLVVSTVNIIPKTTLIIDSQFNSCILIEEQLLTIKDSLKTDT
jgi:hypothetical protein